MGSSGYSLCIGTRLGERQVELNDNDRVEFFDGVDVVEIVNQPDQLPPAGFFPIFWGGQVVLVPFCLTSLSIEQIGNLVRGHFHDRIEVPKGLLTQYDNGPKVVPDPQGDPWAYVAVQYGQGSELYTGETGDFRTDGVLRVELRHRIGVGDGFLLECADDIDLAFRYQVIDPIRYGPPTLRTVGLDRSSVVGGQNSTGSAWWRVDVLIPFAVDRPT